MEERHIDEKLRPYSKPTLTIYGKVQDLTKANLRTGSQDNPTDARLMTGLP
jgi:hypothetical protein